MTERRFYTRLCVLLTLGVLLGGCTFFPETHAVIQVSQISGTVPLTIDYDASASEGPDGISTTRWDFGDGVDVYAVSGSTTFVHAGDFQVELTVRAADGSVDTASITITVKPAFWVADEDLDEIYKLDETGNVLLTLDSPVSQPRGLALAERNGAWSLQVACMGDGFQRLVEMDAETGTVLSERPAPAQDPGGLAYAPIAPLRIWHVDGQSRKIYEISAADGQTLNVFGATYFLASPHLVEMPFLQTPAGLAWAKGSHLAGALWMLEAETRMLYEMKIVPAIDIFSSTQLELQPDPIALAASLFPVAGMDWYDGYLWVVQSQQHQVVQVDPTTGTPTGVVLQGFPGAAVHGLAIQR